jgi:hypothetical protein
VDDNFIRNDDRVSSSEFNQILQENKLVIAETKYFYNPILFPTNSWKTYSSNILLTLLKPLKKFNFIQNIFRGKARQILKKCDDVLLSESNQFKVYILKKE